MLDTSSKFFMVPAHSPFSDPKLALMIKVLHSFFLSGPDSVMFFVVFFFSWEFSENLLMPDIFISFLDWC